MSLCRLYPTPSDRMAIIWTLMPIGDAIVLEYGPAGTTHFGGGLYSSLGIKLDQSLYTTHISEDDVIMGDVSRLEHAIEELDEAYAPKVIFVVASAVIAVIGTDIKGVCQYMQERVNARLVAFEDGGFRGDYTAGLRASYRLLTKEMTRASEQKTQTYQILGASAGSYRVRSDVWELQQLMDEAFGWKCRMVMGLETSVEVLEGAGEASLNLILRQEALEAAEILKTKCDTPYVYGAPYGYQGTLEWLREISKVIGVAINPKLESRLEEKIEAMLPMGGPMANFHAKEPVASIQGDYDTLVGIAKALQEMDVRVDKQICSHSLKMIENASEDILFYAKEKDRIECLKTLHGQWTLGSIEMEQICAKDNYFICISAPFIGKQQRAQHLPFMGEKGMDYLMECKDAYFSYCGI